jgi:hypothetical protein
VANSNKKSVMVSAPRFRFSIEVRSLLPFTPCCLAFKIDERSESIADDVDITKKVAVGKTG